VFIGTHTFVGAYSIIACNKLCTRENSGIGTVRHISIICEHAMKSKTICFRRDFRNNNTVPPRVYEIWKTFVKRDVRFDTFVIVLRFSIADRNNFLRKEVACANPTFVSTRSQCTRTLAGEKRKSVVRYVFENRSKPLALSSARLTRNNAFARP